MVKADPFHHEVRWKNWKKEKKLSVKGSKEISSKNKEIILHKIRNKYFD